MNGLVDGIGRALVTVSIRPDNAVSFHDIDVWIDTGFNGDLVLPHAQIKSLSLPQVGSVQAVLADGSNVVLLTYACIINWFGEERYLEVIENTGDYPLLGVGLLLGLDLHISYRSGNLTIQ